MRKDETISTKKFAFLITTLWSFFWSVFSRIRTRNISVLGYFSHSANWIVRFLKVNKPGEKLWINYFEICQKYRPAVFWKVVVLRKFTRLSGKHLWRSPFFAFSDIGQPQGSNLITKYSTKDVFLGKKQGACPFCYLSEHYLEKWVVFQGWEVFNPTPFKSFRHFWKLLMSIIYPKFVK